MYQDFFNAHIYAKQKINLYGLSLDDTFLTKNITQDRKAFITQSKHMTF